MIGTSPDSEITVIKILSKANHIHNLPIWMAAASLETTPELLRQVIGELAIGFIAVDALNVIRVDLNRLPEWHLRQELLKWQCLPIAVPSFISLPVELTPTPTITPPTETISPKPRRRNRRSSRRAIVVYHELPVLSDEEVIRRILKDGTIGGEVIA